MVTPESKLRIGGRDRLILWHVYRYGLTHKEVVYRMFFDPAQHQMEAARKTLRRLTDGGYLQYLKDPWPYHRLAPAGARVLESLLGLPLDAFRPATRPFKVTDALFQRGVLLAFCCLAETKRELLIPLEVERWFGSWSRRDVRSWPYYLERNSEGAVLCYAIVDSGSSRDAQIHRVNKQLQRRLREIPSLRELERLGRFHVTLLTDAPQRAVELNQAFYDANVNDVQIVAVPETAMIAPSYHTVT